MTKILITGAVSGIGLAIATLMSERGYTILGLDKAEAPSNFPGEAYRIDLLDKAATDNLLNMLIDQDTYAIVNNVAMNIPQAIDEIDYDIFQQTMDLNLWLAIRASQMLVQKLIRQAANQELDLNLISHSNEWAAPGRWLMLSIIFYQSMPPTQQRKISISMAGLLQVLKSKKTLSP